MTTARPILFSAPMIRALIDGRKTQTRRMVKPQPQEKINCDPYWYIGGHRLRPGAENPLRCPYGKPGDLLWVRETFAQVTNFPPAARYYATDDVHELRKKRPSIFMPRWASRLTLEITEVLVERLQDIGESDADAEGVEYAVRPFGDWKLIPGIWDLSALDTGEQTSEPPTPIKYAYLWNTINTTDGSRWADNPWVWALTFRVHQSNIDAFVANRSEAA